MISVIVCSNKESAYTLHHDQIAASIGCQHEYLRIDNTRNASGICTAYNRGVEKAAGDIFVFVHEDVFFITQNWGQILEKKFHADSSIGCIGVAGTQYLFRDNPFWVKAGRPFIKGRVVHEIEKEDRCILTVFSEEEIDTEVVAVDGLFFAIKKDLFDTLCFDDHTFNHFHFYDLDICMQVRKSHKVMVTADILVKHFSGGSFQESWKQYGEAFLDKYKQELPVSCADTVPDPKQYIPFDSMPLNRVLSPKAYSYIKNLGRDPSELRMAARLQEPRIPIVAVTGMHRSGTSCIAGLLSTCGFSLGPTYDLLNENEPQDDNQKGHFENMTAVLINNNILNAAGGSWYNLPSQESINTVGERAQDRFIHFSETFEGSIIKDPRLCMTLGLWKRFCPRLQYVVICFRHPLGVARSLNRRNNLSIEHGLNLWYEYTIRLIDNIEHLPVAVVDYDNLSEHLEEDFYDILRALRSPLTFEEMQKNISGFFEKDLNHNPFTQEDTRSLPDKVKELYHILQSQSIAVRMGRNREG